MALKMREMGCPMLLNTKSTVNILSMLALLGITTDALAEGNSLSSMAQNIIQQLSAIVSLLNATAYVSGVGFAMAGVLQFKVHKENPQQTPLSKPVVMVIVATCLLFLPSIMDTAGKSLLGKNVVSSAEAGGSRDLSGL